MDTQGKGSRKCDQLLAAAERLMLQRGFWGTSVDDVCRAAGVSKGTFFHYFDDKEQLALAALDRFALKMAQRVRAGVSSKDPADAYGRICAYCDLVADTAQVRRSEQGCLIAAFVMESRSDDAKFAKRCASHFGTWIEMLREEFIAALSPAHWPNSALPTELAQLCVCVIEGALILARGRNDPLVVVSALEHFKRYVGATLERSGCLRAETVTRTAAPTVDLALVARRQPPPQGRKRLPRAQGGSAVLEDVAGGPRARDCKDLAASRR